MSPDILHNEQVPFGIRAYCVRQLCGDSDVSGIHILI